MQKTVIINRGIPASGKSTLTNKIVETLKNKEISAVAHSTDTYFIVDGEYSFDSNKLREYHLKNQAVFKKSLEQNIEVVICDNTNIEPWEASPYYEMAKKFNYRVLLIDLQSRDLDSHHQVQNNEGYNRNIPIKTLEDMYERYQNFEELTEKNSYPLHYKHPKRDYDDATGKVEQHDEVSEPFYYDDLIKIYSDDFFKVKKIIGEMIFRKIRDYDLDLFSLIPKHFQIIMKEFHKRSNKTLTSYDLEYILDKSIKQIDRYFKELQSEFSNIIEIKVGRQKAYRLIDSFDIFIDAFKKHDNISELSNLAKKSNPELFKKLEYDSAENNEPYLFRISIIESVQNKRVFEDIKRAINFHEYRKIKFFDHEEFIEIKCIKLVFVDSNWYLAYVDSDEILKLGRVSFIEKVDYSRKNSYQINSIKSHLNNLNSNLQNSMTLFNKEPKLVTLQATPLIAKYFRQDMKKFLKSQKFVEEEADGSVIFTIEYTQPLEVLPFIQKWMPDLIILNSDELEQAYLKKLQQTISTYL